MRYLAAYLVTMLVMLAIDGVWLGVIATSLYRQEIGHLMAENANLTAAAVFYLIYVFGLVFFGVAPHAAKRGVLKSARSAAVFGFIAYATYDLTNLATLRDWPVRLVFIDLAWGTMLSAVAAAAGKFAYDRAAKRPA